MVLHIRMIYNMTPVANLVEGFRPATQIQQSVNDVFNSNGIVREEFDVDEHFIGLC